MPKLVDIDKEALIDFFIQIEITENCWLWTGTRNSGGYGQFYICGGTHPAPRLMYLIYNPSAAMDGLVVCHHCDNPQCVRPDHLFLGTIQDNAIDASSKGRLGKRTKHSLKYIIASRIV